MEDGEAIAGWGGAPPPFVAYRRSEVDGSPHAINREIDNDSAMRPLNLLSGAAIANHVSVGPAKCHDGTIVFRTPR